MSRTLRFLFRLLVVPLGMFAGFITAMTVIVVGYWQIGDLVTGTAVDADAHYVLLYDTLAAAFFLLMLEGIAMWAISIIGILFSEFFAVRSWIFHASNGALSSWLAGCACQPYPDTASPFDGATLYIVGAGFAAGLVYWGIAGWSAGFWKPLTMARPAGSAASFPVASASIPRLQPSGAPAGLLADQPSGGGRGD